MLVLWAQVAIELLTSARPVPDLSEILSSPVA